MAVDCTLVEKEGEGSHLSAVMVTILTSTLFQMADHYAWSSGSISNESSSSRIFQRTVSAQVSKLTTHHRILHNYSRQVELFSWTLIINGAGFTNSKIYFSSY